MPRPTSTPSASAAGRRPLGRILRDGALAWLIGLALAGAGGLVVMQGGLVDTSATTVDNPVVAVLLHHTMIRAVQVRAETDPPVPAFSAVEARRGLVLYQAHCAECHGAPGTPRADLAVGLDPTPPYLLDAARHWSPAELRRIIADGVRMSAMPGWRTSLSGADIQALVDALEVMPYETKTSYDSVVTPPRS